MPLAPNVKMCLLDCLCTLLLFDSHVSQSPGLCSLAQARVPGTLSVGDLCPKLADFLMEIPKIVYSTSDNF